MANNIIKPSILSGFMELLPDEQRAFDDMKRVLEEVFASYGFYGLDTPVLERSSVLLAKGGGETEKQVYRFDRGDTDITMRYDLTVPLARYVAMHYSDLSFPFKRYQIGKVYRGERSQKGRFREFYQCDIDIIGDGTLGIINEAECPSVMSSALRALGIEDFCIRYMYEHWAANSDDDPVSADEIVSEVQNIKDVQFGKQIIKQMEELQKERNRVTEHDG